MKWSHKCLPRHHGRCDLQCVHGVEAEVEDDRVTLLYFGLVVAETHFFQF